MNDSLTLVIPTHERHALLKTVLTYYSQFDYPTIVIDSSSTAFADISSFPAVQYIHCPGEPFPHKLRTPVREHVATPFMFFCPDDMYMAPETLGRCLEFLQHNSDYGSAQGLYLGVPMDADPEGLRAMYIGMDNYDSEIVGETPQERMLQLFCRYIPTFYAVYRTECWKNQLALYPDGIKNYCLAEFFFAMTTAIFGKHKVFSEMYALTYLAPAVNGHDPFFRNELHELATLPRYAEEYRAFEEVVLRYLQHVCPQSDRRGRLFIAKSVALQAWKSKPVLAAADKLKREVRAFFTKVFHKQALRQRRRERAERELQQAVEEREFVLDLIGEQGRAILDRILRQVK